jgi:hypothetical protein
VGVGLELASLDELERKSTKSDLKKEKAKYTPTPYH